MTNHISPMGSHSEYDTHVRMHEIDVEGGTQPTLVRYANTWKGEIDVCSDMVSACLPTGGPSERDAWVLTNVCDLECLRDRLKHLSIRLREWMRDTEHRAQVLNRWVLWYGRVNLAMCAVGAASTVALAANEAIEPSQSLTRAPLLVCISCTVAGALGFTAAKTYQWLAKDMQLVLSAQAV